MTSNHLPLWQRVIELTTPSDNKGQPLFMKYGSADMRLNTKYGTLSIIYSFGYMALIDGMRLSYKGMVDDQDVLMTDADMSEDIKKMVISMRHEYGKPTKSAVDWFLERHKKILELTMIENLHDQ